MFGIGMPELLVVLVIVLVVFGAGKLPEIGAGLGKGIKNFKNASNDFKKPDPEEKTEESGNQIAN